MNDLDERIHRGLTEATRQIAQLEPEELAARLRRRAADTAPMTTQAPATQRNHRRLAFAAGIVLIAGVVGVGLVMSNGQEANERVVADGADTDRSGGSTGFAGWSPGWHELDTGPLPVGEPPSLAWFDGRLYAAVTLRSPDGEADQTDTAGFWAFDPESRKWSELTPPPFPSVEIVATSSGLVAVSGPTPSSSGSPRDVNWATWSPGDVGDPNGGWSTHGEMPVSESLRRVGSPGPTSPHVRRSILWTGKVVIDFTAGSVLDPHDGSAEPLEMPGDLIPYTHLIQATPVWTGTRAVVVGWSSAPGLSWDEEGRFIGEIPGPPMADSINTYGASAVSVAGDAVIFGFEHSPADPGVARVGSDNRWEPLPSVPNSPEEWCPYLSATVSQEVIVQGCDLETADGDFLPRTYYRWKGDAWSAMPDPPRSEHGMQRWLGTDQALVVWSSVLDSFNNPRAPFQWAAVWIPASP